MSEYFETGNKQPPSLEEIKKALGDERFSNFEQRLSSIPGVNVEAVQDAIRRQIDIFKQIQNKLQSFRRKSLDSSIEELDDVSGQIDNLVMESAGWKNSQGVVLNKPDTRYVIAQFIFLQDRRSDIQKRFMALHDKLKDEESDERIITGDHKNLQ